MKGNRTRTRTATKNYSANPTRPTVRMKAGNPTRSRTLIHIRPWFAPMGTNYDPCHGHMTMNYGYKQLFTGDSFIARHPSFSWPPRWPSSTHVTFRFGVFSKALLCLLAYAYLLIKQVYGDNIRNFYSWKMSSSIMLVTLQLIYFKLL